MYEQYGQRMGVADYWMSFLACYGVTFFAGMGFLFASFFGAGFFSMLCVLALLASSVYLRIAQMRRCMDIGWPWQTPWIVLGLGLAAAVVSQFAVILALVMLPVLIIIALADFAFGIVLGFMPSKQIVQPDYDPQAYKDSYTDYGAPNFSAKEAAEAKLRQRAQAGQLPASTPVISASGKRVASVTQSEPEPQAPPPRALGFGRKGVAG
jgi:uncharacterized membrane protein YhaH (DUF805 family)